MSCRHCELGLSARAIESAGHVGHPHDPSDLKRCIDYCQGAGIDTAALRRRMAGRSPWWDALLPHWDELAGLLADEMATRKDRTAPRTYDRMCELLDAVRDTERAVSR